MPEILPSLESDPLPFLRAAWETLLQPHAVPSPVGAEVFTEIVRLYSSPGRHYHTLDHLADVLRLIEDLHPLAGDPDAVRFAAWFHDAVYDPRAADNEEQSADLAVDRLRRLRVPGETVTAARRLILLTKRHHAQPEDRDGHVLLDADLAILGAGDADYRCYARQIRQEYAWVPEAAYREGRAAVLRRFLERPRLYFTEPMHSSREEQARRNLRAEITMLTG
jgi:predicted metal-dependent HD superfamily phosphohydrolase